jgi:metal-dependent amidase/aminoacylase/carboxypeptidase family protein
MAILVGVAGRMRQRRPARGRVVLAFQPSEETGEGAARLIAAPEFEAHRPDLAFALHNLPGRPLGQVAVRAGTFCSASVGLIATLTGRSSHAGEPHEGHSPARAMAQVIEDLSTWIDPGWPPGTLATVVGARLGRGAFGTSPDEATVSATLRGWTDLDLESLVASAVARIRAVAEEHGHELAIDHVEPFPATFNDATCVQHVRDAATSAGVELEELLLPFAWSEDFGHFTRVCPSALFGLGSGSGQPALHAPDYVFPDAIIDPGVAVFSALVDGILG